MTALLAAQGSPTVNAGDLAVLVGLVSGTFLVLAVAGALGELIHRVLDARRAPTPLTPEQLHARGVPTYWADVFPIDAEGEVVR